MKLFSSSVRKKSKRTGRFQQVGVVPATLTFLFTMADFTTIANDLGVQTSGPCGMAVIIDLVLGNDAVSFASNYHNLLNLHVVQPNALPLPETVLFKNSSFMH